MMILEKGGNAFDAAAAAGFMLQVVEPHMNGVGGDAVILIQPKGTALPQVICGQGRHPPAPRSRTTRARASTSCPAPGCWRRAFPARSTPGC